MVPPATPKPWYTRIAIPAGIAVMIMAAALHLVSPSASVDTIPSPVRTADATAVDSTPTPRAEPVTATAVQALADYLSTNEKAFLAALGSPHMEDLDEGRYVCGLDDDSDPPTVNDVISIYDQGGDDVKIMRAAFRHLCPKHLPLLKKGRNGFKDGHHEVGADIKPGTYHTNRGISDCYWERSTPDGSIIVNDFVSFAPRGVTVTIRTGEGFTSQGCGNWIPS